MFFRNLTLFRFPTSLDLSTLDTHLADVQLKPVGPLDLSSRGFVTPFGRHSEELSHRIGDAIWLTVGGEDKLLPASVVNDLLTKKIAGIEDKESRKLGGRARRQLKEDLIHELLPRAFVRPVRTDAMLDLEQGICIVDTSSRKTAEAVVSEIRHALGSFPALPLNAEVAPRSILTGWIAGEPLPDGLSLGDECELKDPTDNGAIVKCQRQELQGDEIGKHLEAGKQASRLALTLDDHVSFVLGEDLVLRKFKLLDGVVDQLESTDGDDIRAELSARFALMAGEVKRLFAVLEPALKLSKAD
ncbi:MAG: recombination-associated protein RdgC [Pseudomonadota bacterium]|nr:recombination-associated protein RdgC [Pseudomonadota bacterium]